MNILILSCGTRCMLVDYFMDHKNGFSKVVATDCSVNSPALYRADKYYIVPRMNEGNYFSTIFDICESEQINAILPLQEDELILVATKQDEFIEKGILPIISQLDIVRICRDKYVFYQTMMEKDVPVVPTYLVDERDIIVKQYGLPIFMKPRYGAGSKSNYLLYKENAIIANVENENEEFVLQPYIEGIEFGVNVYIDFVTRELSEMFVLQKIRMRAGETEKSISVHNEEIKTIVEKICESLPFVGPIDIDMIESNGKYYVLEINPRFGGAYPHAYECGVNFVKLIANNTKNIANKKFHMEYEDDVVAFRYMSISTIKKDDMQDEKRDIYRRK